MKINRYRI